jgi:hypothetical protein
VRYHTEDSVAEGLGRNDTQAVPCRPHAPLAQDRDRGLGANPAEARASTSEALASSATRAPASPLTARRPATEHDSGAWRYRIAGAIFVDHRSQRHDQHLLKMGASSPSLAWPKGSGMMRLSAPAWASTMRWRIDATVGGTIRRSTPAAVISLEAHPDGVSARDHAVRRLFDGSRQVRRRRMRVSCAIRARANGIHRF